MKREEKRDIMRRHDSKYAKAKSAMAYIADALEENGMVKDAADIMKLVYRLEAIQNKYE